MPNTHQYPFIMRTLSKGPASPDVAILVRGGFHLVMDDAKVRSNQRSAQIGALSPVGKQWFKDNGLHDVWRHHHPETWDYTYYSATHKSYARLDHFLASTALLHRVREANIEPRSLSDHALITVTIQSVEASHKYTRWRRREGLLQSPETVKVIWSIIVEYIQHNEREDTSSAAIWEVLKLVTRGEFMALPLTIESIRRSVRTLNKRWESWKLYILSKQWGDPVSLRTWV